jgi:hypothetical protein
MNYVLPHIRAFVSSAISTAMGQLVVLPSHQSAIPTAMGQLVVLPSHHPILVMNPTL